MSKTKLTITVHALDADIDAIATLWNYEVNKIDANETKAAFVVRTFQEETVKPALASLMTQVAQKQALDSVKPLIDAKLQTLSTSVSNNIETI